MEESTKEVPLDGFGGGVVTDGGVKGAVPIEVVFFGGGDGDGGTVPVDVVVLGGGRRGGLVPIELVFFCGGGGGGVTLLWQPPLQLVTTIVEVVRVV